VSSVQDEVAKLSKETEDLLREQIRLKNLMDLYPDLQKYTGRWGKVAYYSKTVNGLVNEMDRRFNCGCCLDSPLEIWPYLESEHGRVYSDPPSFRVGERTDYGATPNSRWEGRMRDAGISDAIITKVQAYFDSCREVEDSEDDE
jgi:hypothetical protein